MGIGFLQKMETGVKDTYTRFIGKTGHYTVGDVPITGTFEKIDFNDGYVSFRPSLVGVGDTARLEREECTEIAIRPGVLISRRPLGFKDLEFLAKSQSEEKEKSFIFGNLKF